MRRWPGIRTARCLSESVRLPAPHHPSAYRSAAPTPVGGAAPSGQRLRSVCLLVRDSAWDAVSFSVGEWLQSGADPARPLVCARTQRHPVMRAFPTQKKILLKRVWWEVVIWKSAGLKCYFELPKQQCRALAFRSAGSLHSPIQRVTGWCFSFWLGILMKGSMQRIQAN